MAAAAVHGGGYDDEDEDEKKIVIPDKPSPYRSREERIQVQVAKVPDFHIFVRPRDTIGNFRRNVHAHVDSVYPYGENKEDDEDKEIVWIQLEDLEIPLHSGVLDRTLLTETEFGDEITVSIGKSKRPYVPDLHKLLEESLPRSVTFRGCCETRRCASRYTMVAVRIPAKEGLCIDIAKQMAATKRWVTWQSSVDDSDTFHDYLKKYHLFCPECRCPFQVVDFVVVECKVKIEWTDHPIIGAGMIEIEATDLISKRWPPFKEGIKTLLDTYKETRVTFI